MKDFSADLRRRALGLPSTLRVAVLGTSSACTTALLNSLANLMTEGRGAGDPAVQDLYSASQSPEAEVAAPGLRSTVLGGDRLSVTEVLGE